MSQPHYSYHHPAPEISPAADTIDQTHQRYHQTSSHGYDDYHGGKGPIPAAYDPIVDTEGNMNMFSIKRKPLATQSSMEEPLTAAAKGEEGSPGSSPPASTCRLQKRQQFRPRHHVLRFWYWEIITLSAATALLISMIMVLGRYNGHEVPEWPLSINLTSLVALLSTVYRAALLLVVAEALSQAKWSWFVSRPRPLHDLRSFDYASRSIWGAAMLIGTAFTSPVAILGCLVTILSLTVGPFTQQAIKTTACQKVMPTNSTVPVASFAPGSSGFFRIGAGLWEPTTDFKGFMVNGLTNPGGNDTSIRATCATGNCTFGDFQAPSSSPSSGSDSKLAGSSYSYETIGMCSKCMDVIDFVREELYSKTRTNNYTIHTGYSNITINTNTLPYMVISPGNLEWAANASTEEFRRATTEALLNVTIITFSKTNCSETAAGCRFSAVANTAAMADDVVAASCTLYPCVKRYRASVSDGVLSETLVGEPTKMRVNWFDNPVDAGPDGDTAGRDSVYHNWTALMDPCMVDGKPYSSSNISLANLTLSFEEGKDRVFNYTSRDPATDGEIFATAPERCMYALNGIYGRAMYLYMSEDLLDGQCTYNSRQGIVINCDTQWWLTPLYNNWTATADTINGSISALSDTMTNFLRQTGYDIVTNAQKSALGTVQSTTICTVFAWRWMIMPCMLLVFGISLLLLIIGMGWMDTRLPVWKSNPLPLFFYSSSIGREKEGSGRSLMDLDGMRDESLARYVRLRKGVDGGFYDVDAQNHNSNDDNSGREFVGSGHPSLPSSCGKKVPNTAYHGAGAQQDEDEDELEEYRMEPFGGSRMGR